MLNQVITISLVSSVVIFSILLLKKYVNKKYSYKLTYYLCVVMSLILIVSVYLDFSFDINIAADSLNNDSTSLYSTMNQNMKRKDKEAAFSSYSSSNKSIVKEKKSAELLPKKVYIIDTIETNSLAYELKNIFKYIWIIGMIIFAFYYACVHLYFARDLKKHSICVADKFICSTLKELSKKYNVKNIPKIYANDNIDAPMVINIINPVIIVPNKLLCDENIEIMLSHELIHIKRKDLLFKYLVLFANAIHWFNPFVYLLKGLFGESCELVCDEVLLEKKDQQYRKMYGNIILNSVEKSKGFSKLTYVGFISDKKTLKNRIKAIADNNNHKNGKPFCVSLCVLICAISLLVVSCTSKNDYSAIQKSVDSISGIGSRIYGSDSNARFVDEIKSHLGKTLSSKWNIEVQDYNIPNPYKYEIKIKHQDGEVVINNENSVFDMVNEMVNDYDNLEIINDIENLEEDKKYIFISDDKEKIVNCFANDNIVIMLLVTDDKSYKMLKNDATNTIYEENLMYGAIDKKTANLFEELYGKEVEIDCNVEFNELKLENIIATMKGKDSSEAVLLTAHLDSVTGIVSKDYSKGILDNGSGVVLLLDMIRKFEASDFLPERDIVFSFVNSEEQAMIRGYGGSKSLNTMMISRYGDFINLNLDCLGQKGVDELKYGMHGNLNEKYIDNLMIEVNAEQYELIREDGYGSDHMNFENALYIYNFDEENIIFHKEKDNKSNTDVNSLEKISAVCYEAVKSLSIVKREEIFTEKENDLPYNENRVISKCDDKLNLYANTIEFGEYVFFKCEEPDVCINGYHFSSKNGYQLTPKDISSLKNEKTLELPFEEGIIYAYFDLPKIEYNNHEPDTVYSYFDEKQDFESIKDVYEINSISYLYYPNSDMSEYYNIDFRELSAYTNEYTFENFILNAMIDAEDYEEIQGVDYKICRGTDKYNNLYKTLYFKSYDGIDYMMIVSSNIETIYDDEEYIVEFMLNIYENMVRK